PPLSEPVRPRARARTCIRTVSVQRRGICEAHCLLRWCYRARCLGSHFSTRKCGKPRDDQCATHASTIAKPPRRQAHDSQSSTVLCLSPRRGDGRQRGNNLGVCGSSIRQYAHGTGVAEICSTSCERPIWSKQSRRNSADRLTARKLGLHLRVIPMSNS